MLLKLIIGAALAVAATLACAATEPELDTSDFGGALFTSWTSRNPHEGHTALIALTSKERVRDVAYRVLVSDKGRATVLANGQLKNMREGDHQILTSQKQPLPDHAEIVACVTYYNIGKSQHYASVSFCREPAIIADGKTRHVAAPSLEQWEAFAVYEKVLSFKDTTLPQGALPKGDIVLEYSTSPLGCAST